jgi:hypothetical protein
VILPPLVFPAAALTTIVKSFVPHANNGNWQSGSSARNGQKMTDSTFFIDNLLVS